MGWKLFRMEQGKLSAFCYHKKHCCCINLLSICTAFSEPVETQAAFSRVYTYHPFAETHSGMTFYLCMKL